jgi:hypothetical protein
MRLPRLLFSPERSQFIVSVALLGMVGGIFFGLDRLARNQRLANWLDEQEVEDCRETRSHLFRNGYFMDHADRFVNEELYGVDYSKGGVYLIGTSTIRCATRLWELPSNQRDLVHNYGFDGSNHRYQLLFLQYLIRQAHMLRAGGGKTLMILGASYEHFHFGYEPDGYFVKLWERHGLYTCSQENGIQPVSINPLWKSLHFERVRIAGCLTQTSGWAVAKVCEWAAGPQCFERRLDIPYFLSKLQYWMGNDWKEKMEGQIEDFGRLADYLRAQNVRLVVVLLPVGSWQDKLPYQRVYVSEMTAICKAKKIPLHDWSRLLKDEDFADYGHPNVFGMDKLQPEFLKIAIPFLRSTHALLDVETSSFANGKPDQRQN